MCSRDTHTPPDAQKLIHVRVRSCGYVPCHTQVALDFIGKRGLTVGASREKRIKYAEDILQREFLPHVGIEPNCEVRRLVSFALLRCHPELGMWCDARRSLVVVGRSAHLVTLASISPPLLMIAHAQVKKAYFFGYIVNLLLNTALGRRETGAFFCPFRVLAVHSIYCCFVLG